MWILVITLYAKQSYDGPIALSVTSIEFDTKESANFAGENYRVDDDIRCKVQVFKK